jgi:hypothetical protein
MPAWASVPLWSAPSRGRKNPFNREGQCPAAVAFPADPARRMTRTEILARQSSILNSIFTTALNDQVTYIHPCRGVKIPTVPATPRTIISPEQFDGIYTALPDADAQLLVETAIGGGLWWGELTELRASDLDLASRVLTVSRKVIELNREFHPDGKRFLVKHYPNDKEYRRLMEAVRAAAADHRLYVPAFTRTSAAVVRRRYRPAPHLG